MPPVEIASSASRPPLGDEQRMAILGNFPPRRCGIATFTHDSYHALKSVVPERLIDVYAMDDGNVAQYPPEVTATLPQNDPRAYMELAERLNISGARMLWIQHEFGIFGGSAGSFLLSLVDRLTIPYAVTLHTVLERPDPEHRRVFEHLIAGASALIVMAERGRETLRRVYGVADERITVIPHGAPDRPLAETGPAKARLGLNGQIVMTFGLLSPGKGIEDMIAAMPAVLADAPDARYLVLGQTHPHLIAREGEAYRDGLVALAQRLGVQDAVEFRNAFVEQDELLDYLTATDVYVTPYHNPDQVTSGTLSYAVALGKPVVSTPYVHAAELLADDHGRLVPFRKPEALAEAVSGLLTDDAERALLALKSYARGRSTTWTRYGHAVLDLFADIRRPVTATIPSQMPGDAATPPLNAVLRMTDDTGMLQHSLFAIPDRNHGYCIDDNARALLLMSVADDLDPKDRMRLSSIYAAFIQHAWNPDEGRYRNFMAFDRAWLESVGSEDSNGRTLWALGLTTARHPDAGIRRWAMGLYEETLGHLRALSAARAQAFCVLGAAEVLATYPNHAASLELVRGVSASLTRFVSSASRPDWTWFEAALSYDNARLPEALIRAGLALGDETLIAGGVRTLGWVIDHHTTAKGWFRPVGTLGFGKAYAAPAQFDQQPLEAWAMIDACAAAFDATREPRWLGPARSAWRWYLGDNDLGLSLISRSTGECYDGLTPTGVNLNNGAESVLAWQLADRAWRRLCAAVQERQEPQAVYA